MQSVQNAHEWDRLFGFLKMEKKLEFNVLKVTILKAEVILTDSNVLLQK